MANNHSHSPDLYFDASRHIPAPDIKQPILMKPALPIPGHEMYKPDKYHKYMPGEGPYDTHRPATSSDGNNAFIDPAILPYLLAGGATLLVVLLLKK